MADERTLLLIKPDGVQRGLVGDVIARFERRGLHLVGLRMLHIDATLAGQHYAEHRGKPFYDGLIEFITAGPVVAMVWEGPAAVAQVRTMMGATDPANAAPGTVRGDHALSIGANVVHGSDSLERAAEEINLFFAPEQLVDWRSDVDRWLRG